MNAKVEFFVKPNGEIMIDDNGTCRPLVASDHDLCQYILQLISKQYPTAYVALESFYSRYKDNRLYYDYIRVHRFIRCNFSKPDSLTFDVEAGVLHIEDVPCPIRCECPFYEVICKPNPLGLSSREVEVAKLYALGKTYDEISVELKIARSTIKNMIQGIKKKLNLKSSRDIAKIVIAVLAL